MYTLDAAPFSDAFLAMVIVLLVALTFASALRGGPKAKQIGQSEEGGS
ncbi:hypothetical protein BH18ACT10_BH18ACT10_07860 [soil metagenome]